jgi:hypothetical protein
MIDLSKDKPRNIKTLLKTYQTPQKGECDKARQYTKRDQRLYERLRYADYVGEELNVKHLKQRIRYIIVKQPRLQDLCTRCRWETIITAIVFYVKCHYNTDCRPYHLERYKICKENDLTLQIYSTVLTHLKLIKE